MRAPRGVALAAIYIRLPNGSPGARNRAFYPDFPETYRPFVRQAD